MYLYVYLFYLSIFMSIYLYLSIYFTYLYLYLSIYIYLSRIGFEMDRVRSLLNLEKTNPGVNSELLYVEGRWAFIFLLFISPSYPHFFPSIFSPPPTLPLSLLWPDSLPSMSQIFWNIIIFPIYWFPPRAQYIQLNKIRIREILEFPPPPPPFQCL